MEHVINKSNAVVLSHSFRLVERLKTALHRLNNYSAYAARYRSRQHLATLSEAHLRDVGITSEQAAKEIAKGFWEE